MPKLILVRKHEYICTAYMHKEYFRHRDVSGDFCEVDSKDACLHSYVKSENVTIITQVIDVEGTTKKIS